jgi:hypothetical protein
MSATEQDQRLSPRRPRGAYWLPSMQNSARRVNRQQLPSPRGRLELSLGSEPDHIRSCIFESQLTAWPLPCAMQWWSSGCPPAPTSLCSADRSMNNPAGPTVLVVLVLILMLAGTVWGWCQVCGGDVLLVVIAPWLVFTP